MTAPRAFDRARLHLIGLASGKPLSASYREYLRTERLAPEEMERLQLRKLRRLLDHARKHVPFYREEFRRLGVRDAGEIDSLRFLEQLPVVDKRLLKENRSAFAVENLRELPGVRAGRTGGTTGEPLRFHTDAETRASIWAAYYRFQGWTGVGLSDPKLVIWGAPVVRPGWRAEARRRLLAALEGNSYLDAFAISAVRFEELRRRLERGRFRHIRGYAQAVYELATIFRERGYRYPLASITTTAEPLFGEYRERFREVFECETFDQYGCGEVQSAAFECEQHAGLHVTRERCLLEIEAGGEVVLTDLDNLATPFIRYRNGDQAESAAGECPCGRPGPRLRRIHGRSGAVVQGAAGPRVHPEFFTHLLNETGIAASRNVLRYQVIQESRGALEWRIVGEVLTAADRAILEDHLRRHLGALALTIRQVEEIPPGRSGKHRYVVVRGEGEGDGEGGSRSTAPPG